MILRLLLIVLALGIPSVGFAQGTFIPGAIVNTAPSVRGFGTLAATNASTLLSTLTVGPNSAAWPATPQQVYVINQTTAAIYVCPLGGTCAASGANQGLLLSPGQGYGFYQPSTNMTVIAPTAGPVQAQW